MLFCEGGGIDVESYLYCIENWRSLCTQYTNAFQDTVNQSYKLYLTWLVVLTVASAWRSTLTTLGWPLQDAKIKAVDPFCEEK